MKPSAKPDELPVLTPRQIYERLDRYVIGQERAKKAVSIAAYNHLKRIAARRSRSDSAIKKSNVLLIGPTGCGKTHIARNLAEILSVPFTACDATEYTEAGYYGKDVEVMVSELLLKANQSVEEAQQGIIFVDEVDKIARRTQGARTGAGCRDIGGEGVQQGLLKMLEGREVYVPLNLTQHWSKHDFVQMDTSDILFICAGTFTDLYAYRGDAVVGFVRAGARSAPRRRITTHQLIEYGMLAELMGRLPVVVELEELSEDQLYEVLTAPPDALMHEYRELLALEEIEFSFSDAALREIARFAHEKRLGARALRSLFEEIMADVMFHAPERRGERISLEAGVVRRRMAGLDPDGMRQS